MSTTALVTDGDQRPALAITRSLGRRGVDVIVGAEYPSSLASSSRYCSRHVTYPSPYTDPDGFETFLLDFVREHRVDVVLPVTDVTTWAVARHQEAILRHTSVAVAPLGAFELVTNKWSLLERAIGCGVPIPRTEFIASGAALEAVIERVQYPAVIKPVRSRTRTERGWQHAIVHYAHSADGLRELYRSIDYLGRYPSLIQERIFGPGVGVFVLCDRGRPLTMFAHRRLREKPPSGGASVLAESVPLDPELADQSVRLLGPLGWHGVAMLEYKRDARTGRAFLMEVNGRFWGSLQLAIDAGVDFPALAYGLALNRRLELPTAYATGVRNRWLLGDLDHMLLRLFHTDGDMPDSAPSRLRVVASFLGMFGRRLHYDVFSRADREPARYELRSYMRALMASMADRRRRRKLAAAGAAMSGAALTPLRHQRQK
jgi:predicted ATP-grasp superfamily ATP-dependent carboligase